jgi:hypothetical protein
MCSRIRYLATVATLSIYLFLWSIHLCSNLKCHFLTKTYAYFFLYIKKNRCLISIKPWNLIFIHFILIYWIICCALPLPTEAIFNLNIFLRGRQVESKASRESYSENLEKFQTWNRLGCNRYDHFLSQTNLMAFLFYHYIKLGLENFFLQHHQHECIWVIVVW